MPNRKKSSNKHDTQTRSGIAVPSPLLLSMLAGVTVLIFATFLAYFPTLSNGFVWDDMLLLTDNQVIKASGGLNRIWCTTQEYEYYPITNTTHWIEWRMWGMNPTGYHVTNLILQIVESLLIWLILRKLSIPGAFLAAMIFAVHPVNVESVAWIAERKDMLAVLFFLLSILSYLKMEIPAPSIQNGLNQLNSPLVPHPSPLFYWLSLLAFVVAMLSKGSVAVLPVMLLGIVWWLRPLTRWDLLRTAPFFLVAAVLTVVNVWFQRHGAEVVIRDAGFAERLLGAGSVVWFYLYKAILPLNLIFIYPQWNIQADKLLWWLPLLAALIVTAVLWRYRRGWSRPLLFAWGFFCVALVPALGFTDVYFMRYSLVADHYQHIAVIGAIALAAAGWNCWLQKSMQSATIMASVLVCTLISLTWRQTRTYYNMQTLFQTTVDRNPGSWMAHTSLGFALSLIGRTQDAIEHYEQALRLKPDYPEAHNDLGISLADTGRLPEAIIHFQQAVQVKPDFFDAHNNLGLAMDKSGRPQEALKQYKEALRLRPDYIKAYNNMGNTLLNIGRPQEAIDIYQQALQFEPDDVKIHSNLGRALLQAGRLQEAIEHCQKALQIKPDYPEAHNNLGNALVQAGRPREAIDHYQQALRLRSKYPEAHNNLANTLLNLGQTQEAIEHFKLALQFRPDYLNACKNLALAYAGIHQSSDAIAAAQKALEIARSHGQTAQAKQIEDWLDSYRAALPNSQNMPPASKSTPPTP